MGEKRRVRELSQLVHLAAINCIKTEVKRMLGQPNAKHCMQVAVVCCFLFSVQEV